MFSVPTRRQFLQASVGTLALTGARPAAATAQSGPYVRHDITSPEGMKALNSYAAGVEAMLKLPPSDPRNWFRYAFIHIMDCPHGNWWFYVWHRAYLGFFERIIRDLSKDPTFALPFWDWTTNPRMPAQSFAGVLTPAGDAFRPFIRNLDVFQKFIQPTMNNYWNGLNPGQLAQLKARGYDSFKRMWDDVNGADPTSTSDPPNAYAGNIAYANPSGARYLTADNAGFDAKTANTVSPNVVSGGLSATQFNSPIGPWSFTSQKTPSHNTPAGPKTIFSTLEGMPHNNVHNYIGGVGPLNPGPYGYMTNFLSPVDPVFFLHHSNMDRLWDVWTRSMQGSNRPWEPSDDDRQTFMSEPFLFFIDGTGKPILTYTPEDCFEIEKFNYVYQGGFGGNLIQPKMLTDLAQPAPAITGVVTGDRAAVSIPAPAIRAHLAQPNQASLFAEVTVTRQRLSAARTFDVFIGTPDDLNRPDADTRHYAGTVAFFGPVMHAMDSMDGTFVVPIPQRPELFGNVGAGAGNVALHVRVRPSHGAAGATPAMSAATIRVR